MADLSQLSNEELLSRISPQNTENQNSINPGVSGLSDEELIGRIQQDSRFSISNLEQVPPFSISKTDNQIKTEKNLLDKLAASPFTTLVGTIGELGRREEGVFANIALDALQSGDFSAKQAIQGATEAVTGERVAQFGDVLKQLGADDTSAAIGGLAMSAFLPSNFILAGAGKGTTLSTKSAKQLQNVYTRTPNASKNPFVGVAANFLGKDSKRVKQLLDNAEIYSPKNADLRNAGIVARKMQRGLKYLKDKAPDVLEPSPDVPFNIAKKAIKSFDETFKQARINHNNLKKQVIEANPKFAIKGNQLAKELIENVKAAEKSLIRRTDVPNSEIAKARSFFAKLIKKVRGQKGSGQKIIETGLVDGAGNPITRTINVKQKEKAFNLQNLFDLREDLGKLTQGTFQVEGAPPVINTTLESLTKRLRGKISKTIQDNFPAIKNSDAQFVALGDIDDALRIRGIRKEGQLGNLLKSKNPNPYKLEAITQLDEILPNNVKVSPALQAFADARDTSLASQLKGIGIKFGDKLGSEKTALNFDMINTPDTQKQLLRKFDAQLPENMRFFDELAKFDLARAFSKAGSIFKASASGNLAAGAVPEAKTLGLLAGVAGTIPPAFARTVQGSQALSRAAKAVGRTQPARAAQIALLRQLAEQQTQEKQ